MSRPRSAARSVAVDVNQRVVSGIVSTKTDFEKNLKVLVGTDVERTCNKLDSHGHILASTGAMFSAKVLNPLQSFPRRSTAAG